MRSSVFQEDPCHCFIRRNTERFLSCSTTDTNGRQPFLPSRHNEQSGQNIVITETSPGDGRVDPAICALTSMADTDDVPDLLTNQILASIPSDPSPLSLASMTNSHRPSLKMPHCRFIELHHKILSSLTLALRWGLDALPSTL